MCVYTVLCVGVCVPKVNRNRRKRATNLRVVGGTYINACVGGRTPLQMCTAQIMWVGVWWFRKAFTKVLCLLATNSMHHHHVFPLDALFIHQQNTHTHAHVFFTLLFPGLLLPRSLLFPGKPIKTKATRISSAIAQMAATTTLISSILAVPHLTVPLAPLHSEKARL